MSHSEAMERSLCPKCGNHLVYESRITAMTCSLRCGFQWYLNDPAVAINICECGRIVQRPDNASNTRCHKCTVKRALQMRYASAKKITVGRFNLESSPDLIADINTGI